MSCLKGELNRLTQLLDTPSVELCPISVPSSFLGLWLYQIKTMLEVFLVNCLNPYDEMYICVFS